MQHSFWTLALGVLLFLSTATLISKGIAWRIGEGSATVKNLMERVNAWWALVGVGLPVLAMGPWATTLLFGFLSLLTLREFLSLTPTRQGDRLALFTAFFIAIPLQYALVGAGWYGMFAILIPVYGFFVLSAQSLVTQDTEHFLERTAKIQWAVMVCVYAISHVPALLFLSIPGYDAASGALVLFFLLVVQLSDVLQYVCGKLFGKRPLAKVLSPNKTWEGLLGGGLLATAVGASLHGFTPFAPWQAALLSLAVVGSGAIGGLVLSAVKRSLGAKDWGMSLPGHGGMLDRLDSVAFSAPLFFHLTRYFFAG